MTFQKKRNMIWGSFRSTYFRVIRIKKKGEAVIKGNLNHCNSVLSNSCDQNFRTAQKSQYDLKRYNMVAFDYLIREGQQIDSTKNRQWTG